MLRWGWGRAVAERASEDSGLSPDHRWPWASHLDSLTFTFCHLLNKGVTLPILLVLSSETIHVNHCTCNYINTCKCSINHCYCSQKLHRHLSWGKSIRPRAMGWPTEAMGTSSGHNSSLFRTASWWFPATPGSRASLVTFYLFWGPSGSSKYPQVTIVFPWTSVCSIASRISF